MSRWLILWFAFFLAGCSDAGQRSTNRTGFPAQPLTTVASDSGTLSIEVRVAPTQPASRGVQSVQFVIYDAATKTLHAGLSLQVVPWMPAHGHGTSVVPSVTEDPAGTYLITNVDFFMPGTWELRTTISDSITDHVTPQFQIP